MSLWRQLAAHLVELHPADAATVLASLPPADAAATLVDTEAGFVAAVLRVMPPHRAAAVLGAFADEQASAVVAALRPRVAALLLARLAPDARERALAALPAGEVDRIRRLLHARPRSASALMDPDALALPQRLTAQEALEVYRDSEGRGRYSLPVVDADLAFKGMVTLRDLMLADRGQRVSALMRTDAPAIRDDAEGWAIVRHPGWRVAQVVSVTTESGELVGAISYRAMRDLEDELRAESEGAEGLSTAQALGELFSTGLAGVVEAVATIGRTDRDA
jgi:magnesium transporter